MLVLKKKKKKKKKSVLSREIDNEIDNSINFNKHYCKLVAARFNSKQIGTIVCSPVSYYEFIAFDEVCPVFHFLIGDQSQ